MRVIPDGSTMYTCEDNSKPLQARCVCITTQQLRAMRHACHVYSHAPCMPCILPCAMHAMYTPMRHACHVYSHAACMPCILPCAMHVCSTYRWFVITALTHMHACTHCVSWSNMNSTRNNMLNGIPFQATLNGRAVANGMLLR